MTRVFFIVNPHAGTRSKTPVVALIEHFSRSHFDQYEMAYTSGQGHAKVLTDQAIEAGYDTIVVCGGDGTVNEVAARLCKTQVKMGILPVGSGNGFARSMGISMNLKNALQTIADNHTRTVDMIAVGDYLFVGLAGLGFDGMIARAFDQSPDRGLREYTRLVLRKFRSRTTFQCEISVDGGPMEKHDLLMLNVSNTGQFGNEVYISPQSVPDDGWCEVSLTRNLTALQLPGFVWRMLRKRAHTSGPVTTLKVRKLVVTHNDAPAHIDGEPVQLPKTSEFVVVPEALCVLTPQ